MVEVWAHNQEADLAHMSDMFRDFPIAVVATSYDIPPRPVPACTRELTADADGGYHVTGLMPYHRNMDANCEHIYNRVRGVRFMQIALALVNRDGDLACVWRFHLGVPSAKEERFMLKLGVEPCVGRVDRARFGNALRACHAVMITDVPRVTSDGAEDIAHLVDCLRNPLQIYPKHNHGRYGLIRLIRGHLPYLYDLRFLAEWRTLGGEEPPLFAAAKAATSLDDLLRSFLALMREPNFTERMMEYNGILCGLGHWSSYELDSFRLSYEEQERQFKVALAEINGIDVSDLEDVHMH